MIIYQEIEMCFSPEEFIVKNQEEQRGLCKKVFTICEEDELLLEINLQNNGTKIREKHVDLQVGFVLREDNLPLEPLEYCYPAREFVLSRENCNYNCTYGYRFPLSFVSALYKNKGITLIFDDQEQSSVRVQKNSDIFQFVIKYRNVPVENGRRNIIIKFHNGDWRQGFDSYKSWYREKYQENEKIDQRLSGCYHIRRYFFNNQFCKKAIYNKEKGFCFSSQYRDDQVQVGGIDVALLFDYAYTPENNIRCGNAQPFSNLKRLEELNKQLESCKREGLFCVYAYFDPYLIQDGSDFDMVYRAQLPVLNEKGEMHHIWSKDQWHPCLSTKEWQRESAYYLEKVNDKLRVDGFYLDEMGNGEQFTCHNRAHNHPIPLDQNKAEHSYTRLLKEKFPDKLFMCEFFPADRNISLFPAVLSDSKTIVDICRFAFPYKKIFKIIDCDRPIGNNTWDINKIFFNGMGLWLDNDLHSTQWYSPAVKALIKKHYQILKQYCSIFESNEVEPLVNVNSEAILANRFTKGNKTIYTFINVTEKQAECYLTVGKEGNSVYDVYNDKSCEVIVENGMGYVKVKLEAYSVGCIYIVDK